jgi:hypothetical protein
MQPNPPPSKKNPKNAPQLERLREVPFLDRLLDIPFVRSLLLGLLPGLALRLFVLLLPLALYPLSRAGGALSWADVDFQVSTQYFTFQARRGSRPAGGARFFVWPRPRLGLAGRGQLVAPVLSE